MGEPSSEQEGCSPAEGLVGVRAVAGKLTAKSLLFDLPSPTSKLASPEPSSQRYRSHAEKLRSPGHVSGLA